MERARGRVAQLLDERGVLLADGATGTNLFDMGLTSGEAPELWCEQHPDRVASLHRAFIEAGADIVLTNSFGGTRHRLKLHAADDRVGELNRRAAAIAREEADRSVNRTVLVAGSIGPTGELLQPLGELTYEGAVEAFREQMRGLLEGGVDLLWAETMSAEDEMRAAIDAARSLDADIVVTASFDTAGRTMMGITPAQIGSVAEGAVAVGANCGVGASDILATLLEIADERPIVVKGNCGLPRFEGTEVVYSGTPEQMAQYVKLAVDGGASIIGGCCGTTPHHLAAMRAALDAHEKGERPSLAAIEQGVGGFVNSLAKPDAPRRRGRRSREAG